MYIRSCLVVLGIALATLSFPVKRNATTVESDIQSIDQQTNSLETAIAAFPNTGGNIVEVIEIAAQANKLDGVVKNSISDASDSTAFTEADGTNVVGLLKTLAVDTQDVLSELVSKQAALENLGASSIALEQLQSLQSDSKTFLADVLALFPADLVNFAQAQVTLINNAFNKAISAFS